MKLPVIRLLWLLTAAATHAVLPGEAIQPKIDAAAPGDLELADPAPQGGRGFYRVVVEVP